MYPFPKIPTADHILQEQLRLQKTILITIQIIIFFTEAVTECQIVRLTLTEEHTKFWEASRIYAQEAQERGITTIKATDVILTVQRRKREQLPVGAKTEQVRDTLPLWKKLTVTERF